MRLPEEGWRARRSLRELIDLLGGPEATKAVGGAVRDTLLGLPVSDVDLATRLPPRTVLERLQGAQGFKAVPTGLKHGTVTAVTEDGPVEVTTLRRDVATDGRHAKVAFTDDWREDARRRDFTMNALYADVVSGAVEDFFGGVEDARAGLVRFIGDPFERIAEDHLRIMRFFRFHARFGRGGPDAAGLAACTARANDLMTLSRERIASELLKLLAVPDPTHTIRLMLDARILAPVLPELEDANALGRLVRREADTSIAPDGLRRLAALIGERPALAGDIARRLKLSNAQAKRLVAAVSPRGGRPDELAYWLGAESAVDRLLLGEGAPQDVRRLDGWERPGLPTKGGDLIARGLDPGPRVAATLQAIERDWVASGYPEGEGFEALVAKHLRRPGGGRSR